jgi:hypothetical protein
MHRTDINTKNTDVRVRIAILVGCDLTTRFARIPIFKVFVPNPGTNFVVTQNSKKIRSLEMQDG